MCAFNRYDQCSYVFSLVQSTRKRIQCARDLITIGNYCHTTPFAAPAISCNQRRTCVAAAAAAHWPTGRVVSSLYCIYLIIICTIDCPLSFCHYCSMQNIRAWTLPFCSPFFSYGQGYRSVSTVFIPVIPCHRSQRSSTTRVHRGRLNKSSLRGFYRKTKETKKPGASYVLFAECTCGKKTCVVEKKHSCIGT